MSTPRPDLLQRQFAWTVEQVTKIVLAIQKRMLIDKDEDVDGEVKNSEMNLIKAYSAQQVPQDIDGPPHSRNNKHQEKRRDDNTSAPTMNLKPRVRKINTKEKREGCTNNDDRNGRISTDNGSSQKIRQPTCSTSLLAAKAFFDHLDATHVLKIEQAQCYSTSVRDLQFVYRATTDI